jgi:hypothetical protein
MAIPDEDRNPHHHRYGDYNRLSGNGRYQFEWTPFTPAIIAWRNADYYLRSARDKLAEASTISGFAIAGLEADHARFVESMKVLAADVDESSREAVKVADALEAANASYSNAADASLVEYQRLCAVIDMRLAVQGR